MVSVGPRHFSTVSLADCNRKVLVWGEEVVQDNLPIFFRPIHEIFVELIHKFGRPPGKTK